MKIGLFLRKCRSHCRYWNYGPDKAPAEIEALVDAVTFNKRKVKKMENISDNPGVELAVVELFEGAQSNSKIAGKNWTSFTGHRPMVISKSFVLPHGLTSISVTSTRQGISTRDVLCKVLFLHSLIFSSWTTH